MDGSMAIHGIQMGANGVGVVDVVDESKTFARFIVEPKLMVFASEEQGVPVFENREYVVVHPAGERDAIKKEATPVDRMRFPKAYAMFKEAQKDIPTGTNVNVIFPNNPAIAHTFAALGIHNIEQLAGMPDSALGNIPFGFDCRKKAIAYLAAQDGAEGFNKLTAQIASKDTQIKSLELAMEEMRNTLTKIQAERETPASPNNGMSPEMVAMMVQNAVTAAMANTKRGPGRPPKEA